MDSLEAALVELADVNYRGAPFLLSYGLTWVVCAVIWRTSTPRVAGLATLFQGMVALPVALGVSAGLGMFEERPGGELVGQLGILISMSQLPVLPLLIVLAVKGRHTAVPLVFSLTAVVHFVPYAWLYQSAIYLVMPVVLAVGLAILCATDPEPQDEGIISIGGAGRVCALTGATLLGTGVAAVVLSI